jgi:hypothetical protein
MPRKGTVIGCLLAADPAILDEVHHAGDIIPALPPALKARLFAAFDLAILWNKDKAQATVTVTITDATLTALPEILDHTQPGYHDTASPTDPASIGHLAQPAIGGPPPQPPVASEPEPHRSPSPLCAPSLSRRPRPLSLHTRRP